MTETTAFERRVAEGMLHRAGPIRPVDDLAIYDAVTAASRSHGWGFTMFSALKFAVAATIVALFGGLLLAGVLTSQHGDEVLPAAATESPSPMTTEEPLSGMTTEEVEPGMFRVLNDGVRDLAKASNFDIVSGHDGGIWVLRPQRFFRLGSDELHEWATRKPAVSDFEVAPDGTVWTVQTLKKDTSAIQSFDGEEWTIHHEAWDNPVLEVTPDGTTWAKWGGLDYPEGFGCLDEGGWQALADLPRAKQLLVASPDDIWAIGWESNIFSRYLYRFLDGAWQRWVGMEGTEPTWQPAKDSLAKDTEWFDNVAVGPDGTFWGVATVPNLPNLVRFDGTGWSRWPVMDTDTFWPATDVVCGSRGGSDAIGVAPDGSVWVALLTRDPCDCDGGVGHFDGLAWDRYLSGLCVAAIDITADGSVWVLAGGDIYVINSEAVATKE